MHRQIYKLYTYTHYIYIYFLRMHVSTHVHQEIYGGARRELRRRTCSPGGPPRHRRRNRVDPGTEECHLLMDPTGVDFCLQHTKQTSSKPINTYLAPSECGHRRHRDGVALRSPGRLPGYRFSSEELSGH